MSRNSRMTPYFCDHIPFYEYFHGDNGRGAGASHQTGWPALVVKPLVPHAAQALISAAAIIAADQLNLRANRAADGQSTRNRATRRCAEASAACRSISRTTRTRHERAGTSPLIYEKRTGQYHCAACGTAQFESETKYESVSGWRSFYAPLPGAIATSLDSAHGMSHTEVHCARCGGHLGNVFPDGPKPTGERNCTNGAALKFEPK